jgi:dTDP-4-dehydrorhamnose reductase
VHDLAARQASGIFNIVGSERLTKYEFGLRVAEAFDLDASRIRRGALAEQKGLVRRPYDMSLSNSKASALLGRKLGNVSAHLRELRHQEQQGRAMELRKL